MRLIFNKSTKTSVISDLDLEWERVPDGADVVVVCEEDAVVADDHAVRVDVLLRPARRPAKNYDFGDHSVGNKNVRRNLHLWRWLSYHNSILIGKNALVCGYIVRRDVLQSCGSQLDICQNSFWTRDTDLGRMILKCWNFRHVKQHFIKAPIVR